MPEAWRSWGLEHNLPAAFSSGYGYDAIAVAFLAKSNPYGVLPAAFLWGGLRNGAGLMQIRSGISIDLVNVIQALVIVFIAADPIIRKLYGIPQKNRSAGRSFPKAGEAKVHGPFERPPQESKRLLCFLSFGRSVLFPAGVDCAGRNDNRIRFSQLGTVEFSTAKACFLLGFSSIFCGLMDSVIGKRHLRWYKACRIGMGIAMPVIAAVAGAGAGGRIDVVGLAAQSTRLATPIALGAISGILCERSGVINIAIEGMMLTAACAGFTAALYAQSAWVGLGAAIVAGTAMAAIHAALSVSFSVDQIISGTAINILAVGGTGFMRRSFLIGSDLPPPGVFPRWPVPGLEKAPVIGKILFQHQPMVYAMFALILIVAVGLFHTRWGLRTRAVGEHPYAAESLGIDVVRVRYVNILLAGAVAGLGGAWFSLETWEISRN